RAGAAAYTATPALRPVFPFLEGGSPARFPYLESDFPDYKPLPSLMYDYLTPELYREIRPAILEHIGLGHNVWFAAEVNWTADAGGRFLICLRSNYGKTEFWDPVTGQIREPDPAESKINIDGTASIILKDSTRYLFKWSGTSGSLRSVQSG